ncbi:hypothetical protein MACK_000487 [Theileria orientalis]|uniref:Uncharacterized protein n=1 Tax=Theileria orientalis TaxID=68886 RepID=A0A976MA05_THEOR|nr:hypothetical protein MACK_000487 [Theileria orientalis]
MYKNKQVTAGKGITWSANNKYGYYVLKNRAEKRYEKRTKPLELNDTAKLGDELDKALFTNSKQLQRENCIPPPWNPPQPRVIMALNKYLTGFKPISLYHENQTPIDPVPLKQNYPLQDPRRRISPKCKPKEGTGALVTF